MVPPQVRGTGGRHPPLSNGATGKEQVLAAEGSFTIEVVRGDVVESRHRIHAVIADRSGTIEFWGDRGRPTIPRSAIKSVQALPLFTTGAADHFDLSEEEVALACASHSGEREHLDAVLRWLERLGLDESDLECGPDVPMGRETKRAFYASGSQPSAMYNCCSGKHAGFLTIARHFDEPTAGYIARHSPVQQRVTGAIEAMTGVDLGGVGAGIDGCGIPVFALPLERLAFAMARLVDPTDLSAELADASQRVVGAAQRAFWVSGTDRTEHKIGARAVEPVVVKAGAEGVFMAALPERGLGIALKAADGTARASHASVKALLRRLGVITGIEAEPILNKAGDVSGELRAVIAVPERADLAPA